MTRADISALLNIIASGVREYHEKATREIRITVAGLKEEVARLQKCAGRDGRDGLPGVPGLRGLDGRDGTPGVDGKDGRDGDPGIDGQDGLGFDDMMVNYDGERTISFEFIRGDHVRSFPVTIPTVLDRGVWREGQYVNGDAVTYAGAFWIAQRETSAKPGDGGDNGWRLAVKSGRQGKSSYDIARSNGYRGSEKEWLASLKGSQGPDGRPGRDFTQIGPDGRRW